MPKNHHFFLVPRLIAHSRGQLQACLCSAGLKISPSRLFKKYINNQIVYLTTRRNYLLIPPPAATTAPPCRGDVVLRGVQVPPSGNGGRPSYPKRRGSSSAMTSLSRYRRLRLGHHVRCSAAAATTPIPRATTATNPCSPRSTRMSTGASPPTSIPVYQGRREGTTVCEGNIILSIGISGHRRMFLLRSLFSWHNWKLASLVVMRRVMPGSSLPCFGHHWKSRLWRALYHPPVQMIIRPTLSARQCGRTRRTARPIW